ncbi:hypothetical protein GDO81_015694 [Engystomops pustulosus]|uniref:Uncharacterized protein n=1 Tax=Engystomops pustulosus TaxID=76066 RepID=A0AAV7AMN4_ENGPU|nr:hypothetical protein GDO81_015694 [Engystomops pustulosus]
MAVLLLLLVAFLFLVKCYIDRVPTASLGDYPAPGPWFCIKRFMYLMIIQYSPKKETSYGALKAKEDQLNVSSSKQLSTHDLETPQKLTDSPHAIDSVYFTAFTKVDKSFIITRIARRSENRCEVWLFMRLDGVGDFEHPKKQQSTTPTTPNCQQGK